MGTNKRKLKDFLEKYDVEHTVYKNNIEYSTGQICLRRLSNLITILNSSTYDKNLDILNIKNIVSDFNSLDDKRKEKLERILKN